MVKQKKKNNTKLAVYFGGLIIFIIIVSLVFKGIDLFRGSKFDGKNRFTLALINEDKIDIISVSPSDGSLSRLSLLQANDVKILDENNIPYDALAKAKKEIGGSPKSQIANLLLHKRSIETNLTIIDIFNLWLVSRSVPSENISTGSVNADREEQVEDFASTYFVDPVIVDEDLTIQVINTTEKSGLGTSVADFATNLGGNVVLVNSSRDKVKESRIYYREQNYTAIKLSRVLGIKAEKKDVNSISDIIVSIGEDF